MSFWSAARNLRLSSGAAVVLIASGTLLTVLYAWLTTWGLGDAAQEPGPGLGALLLAGAGLSFLVGARIGLRGYRRAMGQKDEGTGR